MRRGARAGRDGPPAPPGQRRTSACLPHTTNTRARSGSSMVVVVVVEGGAPLCSLLSLCSGGSCNDECLLSLTGAGKT